MTDDESPKWIDRVVSVAGALGFNQVRVRWKLQRWVNERQRAKNRRAQQVDHLKYEHRVCPKCTAVNARDEKVCTRCGTPLSSRPVELLGRLGLRGPVIQSMSTVISFAILAVYARTAIAGGSPWSIPVKTLWLHGGNLPADVPQESWRYLTSILLHAGILHLVFNLISLGVVGPQVEEDYGKWPMLFLFMVTGVVAAVFSRYTGLDGVGIGASGAGMGLIGVAAAAGHRAGTARGRHLRNDMLKWAVYVLIFGYFVHADNRAHLGGLVAGGVLGLLVTPRMATRTRPARIVGGILGGVAMVAMLGAVALTMVPHPPQQSLGWGGEGLLFDQSSGDPGDLDDVGTAIWICSASRRGEDTSEYIDAATVREVCAALDQMRVECARVDPERDEWEQMQCAEMHRLGGLLRPPP